MQFNLKSPAGIVVHRQEVIHTGKLPEIIRWNNKLYGYEYTNWPRSISTYVERTVWTLPPELPASRND